MRPPMLVKHSVRIAGHSTSVSLEAPFWEALCDIAAQRGQPVNLLLAEIDRERRGNLSSAVRLFVLESCRRGELAPSASAAAAPAPHGGLAAAGNGTHCDPVSGSDAQHGYDS